MNFWRSVKKMAERIKLTEDDICLVDEGDGNYSLKFASLEGFKILWTCADAKQLKHQILENQKNGMRKVIVYQKIFQRSSTQRNSRR